MSHIDRYSEGGYGYKAIIAPLCFWLDATIYKPSEYETEYDMMTFREIH